MSNLVKDLSHPHRRAAGDTIRRQQEILYSVQRLFAAETLAFKALRLAWESVRLAWYAVVEETDGDHLDDVRAALRAVEAHIKRVAKENQDAA